MNPDEFIDHSKSTSGLQSDTSQKTTTEKKHSTTYVKTASGKSDKGEPLLVGVVVGAIVLLLAALGIGLWFLLAPSGDEVADRSGGENNGEVVSEEAKVKVKTKMRPKRIRTLRVLAPTKLPSTI